jgi:hypothetical protein
MSLKPASIIHPMVIDMNEARLSTVVPVITE